MPRVVHQNVSNAASWQGADVMRMMLVFVHVRVHERA